MPGTTMTLAAMTTSGAKRSVRAWLIKFYADNPQEELSFADIVKKYGCSLWTARQAVYELQRDGVLESVHVVRTRIKGMGK
jgi:Fic family protein